MQRTNRETNSGRASNLNDLRAPRAIYEMAMLHTMWTHLRFPVLGWDENAYVGHMQKAEKSETHTGKGHGGDSEFDFLEERTRDYE